MGTYHLWVVFAAPRFQWPLRAGGYIELRDDHMEAVAQFPAALVTSYLAHALDGLALQADLAQQLSEDWRREHLTLRLKKPLTSIRAAVYDASQRADLKLIRRSRKSTSAGSERS